MTQFQRCFQLSFTMFVCREVQLSIGRNPYGLLVSGIPLGYELEMVDYAT